MIVSTTENLVGYRVTKVIGEVFGLTVRTRWAGGNLMAQFRGVVGGEVKSYTKLLETARLEAVDRLRQAAETAGGNAVVMMRFDSSEIANTMSEIVAYGTAVVAEAV